MRLKNILFTIAATTWLFSSCSEETLIDGPVISGGEEATISATLSINSVETKATTNYETPVSDNEELINNYVIAVFDAARQDVVGLKAETLDTETKSFTVNVVAKCDGESPQTVLTIANLSEEQLKACKAFTTYTQFANLIVEQKSAFKSSELMKGAEQVVTLEKGKVNNFDIKLDQLVARVDVSIGFPDEDKGASFDIQSFKVEGVNTKSKMILTDKTKVVNNEVTSSSLEWQEEKEANTIKNTFSFYTYERSTDETPITITITGLLKKNDSEEGSLKTYTYALNPVKSQPECNTTGIVHGNTYQVKGLMSLPNKTVTFTVKAKGWVPVEVDASINNMHYLFVSEHIIHMPNTTSYTFGYVSDLEVDYEIVSAEYVSYTADETEITGSYTSGDKYYPTIVINNGVIEISFGATPVNYVPTHIELKIKTTTGGLEETVMVTHYPTPYVEVHNNNKTENIPELHGFPADDQKYGYVPYELWGGRTEDDNQTNFNLFTITSIAAGGFIIGDPRDGEGKTGVTEEANKLVSPQFVIASQHGITTQISYEHAEDRCSKYIEYPYLEAGTWRIPTTAELQYIAKLQYDPNSAVKSLLIGGTYWSARWAGETGIHVNMNGNKVASTTSSNAISYVRCVHDVY